MSTPLWTRNSTGRARAMDETYHFDDEDKGVAHETESEIDAFERRLRGAEGLVGAGDVEPGDGRRKDHEPHHLGMMEAGSP